MRRGVAEFAPDPALVRALHVMFCWPGAFNRLSFVGEWRGHRISDSRDFGFDDRDAWSRFALRWGRDYDVLVSPGLRPHAGFGSCDSARVLWARVEGKQEAARLRAFRPSPTLVFREGESSRMVGLWVLRRPLRYEPLVRANRRLAHALFAPKKWSAPEFMFPLPGSCLRDGRRRPVPVHVEFFDPGGLFTARQVVGALKDAPDPNAWREAVAA